MKQLEIALAEEIAADTCKTIEDAKALARLVVGSVADKVLRGSTLPVLVKRPRDK